jgi:hypothetical protein
LGLRLSGEWREREKRGAAVDKEKGVEE